MRLGVRVAIALIVVGVIVPLILRMAWGAPIPGRGDGFRAQTDRIVLVRAEYAADYYDRYIERAQSGETSPQSAEPVRTGIHWAAAYSDAAGLVLALGAALWLVLSGRKRSSASFAGAG